MTGLTLEPILLHAGLDLDALVTRHSYAEEHEDSGLRGMHAESTDAESLAHTNNQLRTGRRHCVENALGAPRYPDVSR